MANLIKICDNSDKDKCVEVYPSGIARQISSEDLALVILDTMNGGERQFAEAMGEELMREHRTIQQNFWRSISRIIKKYAIEAEYDGRNENSKIWTEKCMRATEDVSLPLI